MSKKIVEQLTNTIASLNDALSEELDKAVLAGKMEDMVSNAPEDISARYWLMQFMEPLNRKELKQFVDGFLIQLLNEDQAKKLVKFLLVRFPAYYREDLTQQRPALDPDQAGSPMDRMESANKPTTHPDPIKAD